MTRAHRRFVACRKALGLSQEAFADLLGCSQSMVCAIEKGERTPASARLTHAIEHASAGWKLGPIRSVEWFGKSPAHQEA